MKRIFTILLFMITAQLVHAQTTVVSGNITDNKKKPLRGVGVSILNSYDGATTDSLGNYTFTTTEKGPKIITATFTAYKDVDEPVTIVPGQPIKINFILKESLSEMKAVIVTAGSFAAGDSKRGSVLSSIDVATTAGSNADITSALKTLPGTQQIGEQEGLFVRGGEGYETKQYIDGTLVNNPYYSSVPDIAQRGRFSPFLFKGTVFSTGGYSALYGQALSSVLLLESIDMPEKTEIDASVSPIVVGTGFQHLAKDKKSSWGFSYDYVNVALYFAVVKQTPDYFRIPQFHNGDANFRIKTKHGGIIKYYTTFAYNDLGLRRQDDDSLYLKNAFGLTNHNWYNNLSYRENLGKGWKMNLGTSFSTNLDNITQQVEDSSNQPKQFDSSAFWMQTKNFTVQNLQNLFQVKAVFEKKLTGISSFRFGSEYSYAYNRPIFNDTLHTQVDNYSAYFAEASIFLTNDIAAQIGVRAEHSSLINKSDVAPRISLAYKTGQDAQLSAAFGTFYQKPEETQLFYNPNTGFTKATHYILNYQYLNPKRIFRVEAYYKKYNALVTQIPYGYNYYSYDVSGSGYAQGLDIFYRDKKMIKNFDYWISYSYVDSKRQFLNYPTQLQPDFVATHTASLVTKRFFTKIKSGINFTYSWASGRPYYDIRLNSGNKYYIANQGMTKDYNSLNFSAEYIPTLGKKNAHSFIVLFASMTNVLGTNQIYGYHYSYDGSYKSPVQPPATRFYFIGCFLSWGVDRTQDAIDNNL
jgi:carboxypeptidase-like protein